MRLKRNLNIVILTQWIIVIGIFTERYYELILILFVALLLSGMQKKIVFSKTLLLLAIGVFIYSLLALSYVAYPYQKFIQQFILLLVTSVAYYQFFTINQHNINDIFRKYLKVAYVVALLGIIQWVVFLSVRINIFQFLYSGNAIEIYPGIIRITSIIDEPSYLSTLLTPAAVYYSLKKNRIQTDKWQMYIIYLAIFLTLSTVTYVILVLFFIYKYLFYVRSAVYRVAFTMLLFVIFLVGEKPLSNGEKTIFSDVILKISDSFAAFADMDPYVFESLNLSSYATMTNLWVAVNAPLRISGTGLGSHEQSYEYLYQSDFTYYGLNSKDGYSLANRIFSEFGVVGITALCIWLIRNYNKKNIINVAVLFLLLTLLIRGGHYTRYGLVFFVFMYYYTHKLSGNIVCKTKN